MDMSGTYRIAAPRRTVWEALNDPDVLGDCITGCQSLDKISDTEFRAVVAFKVGPVAAKFSGKVTLSELDPPNGCRISGEGSGGAAGFARGGAQVGLAEAGGETVLTYLASAQVGGKIAQVGARLIDGVAKKMADEFFAKFSARLGAGDTAAEPAAAAPAAAAEPEVAADAPEPTAARKPNFMMSAFRRTGA